MENKELLLLGPKGESIKKVIPMQFPGQDPSHPHGHWMSADIVTW